MKPHKTVVERGDTYAIELELRMHQPEGWFEYFPVSGDEVLMYIKKQNKVITELTITIDTDMEERLRVNIPTHLPKGDYTYDVILKCANGEKHTICDEYILRIKEDSAYA